MREKERREGIGQKQKAGEEGKKEKQESEAD